jgi:hypothetical protein
MTDAQPVSFAIGTQVSCADGPCGRISRLVVDPVAKVATHLVVDPAHWSGLGRLVPIALAEPVPGGIRLACTRAEFEQLDAAEETEFISPAGTYGPYQPSEVLVWPYYSLGAIGTEATIPPSISYDTVPLGEVEVRRGERVHATDGSIGHVAGLVVDARSQHVTHVLLSEGHLWGRKQVAIPIAAVATLADDGIRLSMSKREVGDLPPVDIDQAS